MQRDSEDEVWRTIVENYGDRVELAPEEVAAAPEWAATASTLDPPAQDDERFVPPTPPPLPHTTPDRYAAWAGVLGAPVMLVLALLLRVTLPTWLGAAMVIGFVGGFVYLVFQMPRGPRDPGDDGARL
ncbi:hypothetical protein [Nocardioides panaciterrulae]|uniref:Uncharacterized protein n=1 Tax=Nocardioides panaciterrulae TaxID=661492 RepID=A0A7Y9E7B1_9ACTN|nr:hypothetical protein [Nocardioides panaciterrulae]NYD42302.1 hypothetical protein [Nocardioides panaciterrulae]